MNEQTPASTPTIGRVLNVNDIPKSALPANTIFIDKGSIWANPFVVGRDGTREECVRRYNLMLAVSEEILNDIDHLKGKDLVCYCGDQTNLCHGHTLVYLASIPMRARLDWAKQVISNQGAYQAPEKILIAA